MRELLSRKLNHMQPGLAPASHRSSISNGASRCITSKQLQQNARPEQRVYTSTRIRSNNFAVAASVRPMLPELTS
jgi:hypothetical protein